MHPARTPDKDGYYRLGRTTLLYFLFKYGYPAVILFFLELMIVGALMGGKNLPPFSEFISSNGTAGTIALAASGIVPLLMVIAIAFAVIAAYVSYWSFRYKVEYNYLSFVKGIINRQKISVPFRQVQNVDIDQNFIYRIFGLVSLVILTMGNEDPQHMKKEESEIVLPPLNVREGTQLQKFLLDRSNIQRIVAQNPADEATMSPPTE
jgi:uncharacterized membrane protein YdbT with pleckstrin-like domain